MRTFIIRSLLNTTRLGRLRGHSGLGDDACECLLEVPLQEARVGLPVGEAGAPHPDVLQQPEVAHLVAAALLLEQQGGLDVVGLDAADVVGLLRRGDHRVSYPR